MMETALEYYSIRVIDQEQNKTKTIWIPSLYFSDERKNLPMKDVKDYLPYLCMQKTKHQLLFRRFKTNIRFRYVDEKRDVECFLISGVTYRSFSSKIERGKNGKIKA